MSGARCLDSADKDGSLFAVPGDKLGPLLETGLQELAEGALASWTGQLFILWLSSVLGPV